MDLIIWPLTCFIRLVITLMVPPLRTCGLYVSFMHVVSLLTSFVLWRHNIGRAGKNRSLVGPPCFFHTVFFPISFVSLNLQGISLLWSPFLYLTQLLIHSGHPESLKLPSLSQHCMLLSCFQSHPPRDLIKISFSHMLSHFEEMKFLILFLHQQGYLFT